ncbi:aminoacyl-tRNA hydrolase [Ureaplasma ceti]|uniref:Peptidyl-tRNA hydrolase n=1 Tax=Ureaplasma ceti TaxID=3119530 RepID=A0ABP9U7A1_9BACT
MDKFLIVGLGNPEKKYDNTKHQMGFMTIDVILKNLGLELDQNKFNGAFTSFKDGNSTVFVAKPLTYMNLSGEFIAPFMKYNNIPLENLLVIYDDMDTKVGSLKIKPKGSSGGQNGMKNIINLLKSENVRRIKIGIGRPGVDKPAEDKKDFVLSKLSPRDAELIYPVINKAAQLALSFPRVEFEKLMNLANTK